MPMMPNSVALGVPGVQIAPGDHICAFYPSLADRDEILVPYLNEGLTAGEKNCDDGEPDSFAHIVRTS